MLLRTNTVVQYSRNIHIMKLKHITRRQYIHIVVLVCSAAALVVVFFHLAGNLKERLYAKATAIEHKNSHLGYAFSAPPSWTFDSSRTRIPVDMVQHVSKRAIIFIEAIEDPAFTSEAGIFAMERKIKNDFAAQNRYSLEQFDTITWKKHPAFRIQGRRTGDAGTWKFTQYVIFTPGENRAYNITATVADGFTDDFEHAIKKIISSLSFAASLL